MAKSRSFYVGSYRKTGRVAYDGTSNDDWILSLGMHNFRASERETLRVLSDNRLDAVRTNPFVKTSRREGQQVVAKLPLCEPVRRAHKRRLKKKSQRLSSLGLSVGGFKNPVKVKDVASTGSKVGLMTAARAGLKASNQSQRSVGSRTAELITFHCRTEERWVDEFRNEYITVPGCYKSFDVKWYTKEEVPAANFICSKGDAPRKHDEHCLGRLVPVKTVHLDDKVGSFVKRETLLDMRCGLSRLEWKRKHREYTFRETYKRRGSNRREKRANWVVDKLVKNVPQRIRSVVREDHFVLGLSKVLKGKGSKHSNTLTKHLEIAMSDKPKKPKDIPVYWFPGSTRDAWMLFKTSKPNQYTRTQSPLGGHFTLL